MSLIPTADETLARVELLRQCAAVLAKSEEEYVEQARDRHRAFAAWVNSKAKGQGSFAYTCERLDLDPATVRAGMAKQ
jgi:hypothetical protein